MKALIVDDESKAREVLALLLQHHVPEIREIRHANGGLQASDILKVYSPDLVFLDIKMPGQDGFGWLRSLDNRNFDVIFTTAYDQYAIKAIRYSAFDYLLKPVDIEDLREAMTRYGNYQNAQRQSYENLFYNTSQKDPNKYRLTISTTEGTYYLDPREIIRCAADGNYTHFHLNSKKPILASRPLGHYSALLPEALFIRCHKSHLVNRNYIESITDKKMHIKDGATVDVSRRRMASVKATLES